MIGCEVQWSILPRCRDCLTLLGSHDTSFVARLQVPTTDLPVHEIPALLPWFRAVCRDRVFPLLARLYPNLCGSPDGSSIRVNDGSSAAVLPAFTNSTLRTPFLPHTTAHQSAIPNPWNI